MSVSAQSKCAASKQSSGEFKLLNQNTSDGLCQGIDICDRELNSGAMRVGDRGGGNHGKCSNPTTSKQPKIRKSRSLFVMMRRMPACLKLAASNVSSRRLRPS